MTSAPPLFRLYNAVLAPARAGAALAAAFDARDPERRREWDERRARRLPVAGPGTVWIHGASVGEARIVGSLASALRRAEPSRALAASAVTRTGRAQLPAPPAVDAAFFAPLDFPGLAARVLAALAPTALVLVETELWPNWLAECARAGVPVVVVNGRLSPERMRRYQRFRGLYAPLLQGVAAVGAQSEADAERFAALGLPAARARVTGNVKYDLPPPAGDAAAERRRFGLDQERPVLVAGSTGEGEDAQVLAAFLTLRRTVPHAWLVLAPRHPHRCDAVERLVRDAGLSSSRLTRDPADVAGKRDVLLVDSVGELSRLYRLARVAFVGGSLVPVGGHNLLEPAALGLPVLFGPHTHHVTAPATELLASGGALCVADEAALGQALVDLFADPALVDRMGRGARAVFDRNGGALDRSVALVREIVGRSGGDGSPGAARL